MHAVRSSLLGTMGTPAILLRMNMNAHTTTCHWHVLPSLEHRGASSLVCRGGQAPGSGKTSASRSSLLLRWPRETDSRGWRNARVTASAQLSSATASNDYYDVLGVSETADQSELKKAYRRLALQFHPDVSTEADANSKFLRLSAAYEVLVDPEQRALYDKYGPEGLTGRANKSAGAAWEAWDTWDEFQPFQRKTRKGSARQAAANSEPGMGKAEDTDHRQERDAEGVAQMGDVVEYPLAEAAQARLGDGRTKGVGFVVGRNLDRGDRDKLPPESLELVELEPLYCEAGEEVWRTDPLESAAFARLSQLRVLRSKFAQQTDSWLLLDELSPGCGSPEYHDDIIV